MDLFTAEMKNAALELATEWGENFRKPIDGRLLERFPELQPEDVAPLCNAALAAESFIYELGEREFRGEISEGDIAPLARREFAWLDDSNVYRLRGIAMFYARK
jgi:hypothetical protein